MMTSSDSQRFAVCERNGDGSLTVLFYCDTIQVSHWQRQGYQIREAAKMRGAA
tara:strand:+ start:182984 stop:183142 length:159 start_codon:yes stop_codon:yes gene_type:complete